MVSSEVNISYWSIYIVSFVTENWTYGTGSFTSHPAEPTDPEKHLYVSCTFPMRFGRWHFEGSSCSLQFDDCQVQKFVAQFHMCLPRMIDGFVCPLTDHRWARYLHDVQAGCLDVSSHEIHKCIRYLIPCVDTETDNFRHIIFLYVDDVYVCVFIYIYISISIYLI